MDFFIRCQNRLFGQQNLLFRRQHSIPVAGTPRLFIIGLRGTERGFRLGPLPAAAFRVDGLAAVRNFGIDVLSGIESIVGFALLKRAAAFPVSFRQVCVFGLPLRAVQFFRLFLPAQQFCPLLLQFHIFLGSALVGAGVLFRRTEAVSLLEILPVFPEKSALPQVVLRLAGHFGIGFDLRIDILKLPLRLAAHDCDVHRIKVLQLSGCGVNLDIQVAVGSLQQPDRFCGCVFLSIGEALLLIQFPEGGKGFALLFRRFLEFAADPFQIRRIRLQSLHVRKPRFFCRGQHSSHQLHDGGDAGHDNADRPAAGENRFQKLAGAPLRFVHLAADRPERLGRLVPQRSRDQAAQGRPRFIRVGFQLPELVPQGVELLALDLRPDLDFPVFQTGDHRFELFNLSGFRFGPDGDVLSLQRGKLSLQAGNIVVDDFRL